MTKVSVIIPVYNGEKTVKRCVDSVLAQTLEDIEVIVVNDGSDDGTDEILKSYGERITVLEQNRGGQGNARNAGIAAAKSEYLGFVDADDTVERGMYESMYRAAKRDRAQTVQCGIRDIKEDGTAVARSAFCETVAIENRADYVYEYFYRLKHTNEVCNKLIEKRFLTENSLAFSDTAVYFSEDFKLNMEMLLYLERITFVDGCFYNYFIKDSGHCRSDMAGRLPKILNLFKNVLARSVDSDTRKSLECVAALTMLLYARQAAETAEEYVLEILDDKDVKRYIKTSMTYRSNLKHFCLYFLVNNAPGRMKLYLLNRFFTY